MRTVKILHLYPEELSLYGDRGNVLCLKRRLEARGCRAEILKSGIGDLIPDFDIMFIGGGQDKEMRLLSFDLRRKADIISYCVKCGKTVLAVCAGYQLLGEYYRTYSGETLRLCGALPFYTLGGKKRVIGNTVFQTDFGKVVGFENHSGRTYLSDGLSSLGRVISGFGNNGKDKTEGVLYKNTFGTYAHGPVLPKNPALADELIKRALCVSELPPIDDETENLCHRQLVQRFS